MRVHDLEHLQRQSMLITFDDFLSELMLRGP